MDHFSLLSRCVRFDAVIISSEVGYEKPDEKIFQAALGMCMNANFFLVIGKELMQFSLGMLLCKVMQHWLLPMS